MSYLALTLLKTIDITYFAVATVLLSSVCFWMVETIAPPLDKNGENQKVRVFVEIVLQIACIMLVCYMIRNIVHHLPSPSHNIRFGTSSVYLREKVPDFYLDMWIVFCLYVFQQKKLADKIHYLTDNTLRPFITKA